MHIFKQNKFLLHYCSEISQLQWIFHYYKRWKSIDIKGQVTCRSSLASFQKLRVYLFSSWHLRQDLRSLRLTHWLCSSGLCGSCRLWKWILYCLLRRGCLLYSLLLGIKYDDSVLCLEEGGCFVVGASLKLLKSCAPPTSASWAGNTAVHHPVVSN